jgi:hypothetical protein
MSSVAFNKSSTQYCTFEKRYDSNGKVWMQVQAHGTLVAETPYGIVVNEFGNLTQALPAANKYIYVGVPENAVASGAIDWIQIGGYKVAMITASLSTSVGHGLTVNTGAVADIGADFSGAAGEFACNTALTASATIHTVILWPEKIITI